MFSLSILFLKTCFSQHLWGVLCDLNFLRYVRSCLIWCSVHGVFVDMTADELQQLFDGILMSLPLSDQLHYTAREVLIDWSLVKFENFAADYCKRQWLKIAPKVSRYFILGALTLFGKLLHLLMMFISLKTVFRFEEIFFVLSWGETLQKCHILNMFFIIACIFC